MFGEPVAAAKAPIAVLHGRIGRGRIIRAGCRDRAGVSGHKHGAAAVRSLGQVVAKIALDDGGAQIVVRSAIAITGKIESVSVFVAGGAAIAS